MLVQSGGGNVYAILANNDDFELGILPSLHLQSTTIFLALRLRYKSIKTEYLDPMLVPKQVLVGGIERSGNALRGTMLLNAGFTPEKVGAGFPDIVAARLVEAAPGLLVNEGECLTPDNVREDFKKDFAQLVMAAIAPVYPAKDFSKTPILLNPFDMMLQVEQAKTAGTAFQALPGGKATPVEDGPTVSKFNLVGSTEDDEGPTQPPEQGVDKGSHSPSDGPSMIHVIGQAPPGNPKSAEGKPTKEPTPSDT